MGDADAALSRRRQPFLQRNWRRALSERKPRSRVAFTKQALDQGYLSALGVFVGSSSGVAEVRAAKRCLRLDSIALAHKDVGVSWRSRDFFQSRGREQLAVQLLAARCRISFSTVTGLGVEQVLACQSQMCTVVSYNAPRGPGRVYEVALPQPFLVSDQSLLTRESDEAGARLSLVGSCSMVVEVEATGAAGWPPPDMSNGPLPGNAPSLLVLGRFDSVFEGDAPARAVLSRGMAYPKSQNRGTDFDMHVGISWSAGIDAASAFPRLSFRLSSLDVRQLPGNGTPVSRKRRFVGTDDEDADEGDEAPGRSLRARDNGKNYNLKALSDKAHGKQRKPRQRPKTKASAPQLGRVSYRFGDRDMGTLENFGCLLDAREHCSLAELAAHMAACHTHLDVEMYGAGGGSALCKISLDGSGADRGGDGRSAAPLPGSDFREFLGENGAYCMTTRPQRPHEKQHERWPAAQRAQVGLSEAPSRQGADDPPGLCRGSVEQWPKGREASCARARTISVPRISHTLYQPISYRRLIPGAEHTVSPPDETWLHERQRANLSDYTDLTGAEVGFMGRWAQVCLDEKVASERHASRAWASFADEHAAWILAGEERTREFAKHTAFLAVLEVLEPSEADFVMRRVLGLRRGGDAEVERDNETFAAGDGDGDEAMAAAPRESDGEADDDCCNVCRLRVDGPDVLVCSNRKCNARLYHSACAAKSARDAATNPLWLCNACHTATPRRSTRHGLSPKERLKRGQPFESERSS